MLSEAGEVDAGGEVDAAPFDLVPDTTGVAAPAAALCIHGLTGTPYEVRPIAQALIARGIRARGPVLPGHDSSPEELSRLLYTAWLDAVRDEYAELRRDHESVFLVGMSLGGLLSLALAAETPPCGIVVVGAPLAFRQPIPALLPLLKLVKPMLSKKTGSDIRDPEARKRHPGYDRMPLASVHQLVRLQRHVRAVLSRIEAPALVAHGYHDSTANPRDAQRIYDEISSSQKQILILSESAHVVPVDFDGQELCQAAVSFLEDLLPGLGPAKE